MQILAEQIYFKYSERTCACLSVCLCAFIEITGQRSTRRIRYVLRLKCFRRNYYVYAHEVSENLKVVSLSTYTENLNKNVSTVAKLHVYASKRGILIHTITLFLKARNSAKRREMELNLTQRRFVH